MLDVVHAAVVMGMTMLMIVLVMVLMRLIVRVFGFMMMIMLMVMIVMMVVVVVRAAAAFFFAVDGHGHVCAGDAALDGGLCGVLNSGDAARIQLRDKGFALFLGKKLEKGCAQHVARSAHGTVDVENLHFFASIWLIMPAR